MPVLRKLTELLVCTPWQPFYLSYIWGYNTIHGVQQVGLVSINRGLGKIRLIRSILPILKTIILLGYHGNGRNWIAQFVFLIYKPLERQMRNSPLATEFCVNIKKNQAFSKFS